MDNYILTCTSQETGLSIVWEKSTREVKIVSMYDGWVYMKFIDTGLPDFFMAVQNIAVEIYKYIEEHKEG